MKKVIAILMLCAVLIGTIAKDLYVAKNLKASCCLSDDSSEESDSDDDCDTKDLTGKEFADKFHIYHSDFTFSEHLHGTLFSCVSTHSSSFENPYLESVSLPPEAIS